MKKFSTFDGELSSLDCDEVLKNLFWEYSDYEQIITSHHDVMRRLRDYYYLHYTGQKYGEWLKSQ